MQIINHRLHHDDGTPYRFIDNPNYPRNTKIKPCEYLIIHYTTGTMPQQTINWFTNPMAKASAHLLITREGEIIQFVPFDTVGWHAGNSQWAERTGLNRYSIGIELDNAGRLINENGQWKRLNTIFPADQVLVAQHKLLNAPWGWEKYPQAQMDALREVARLLNETYHFVDILGHDDVSTMGKLDPGPAFDMVGFRNEIMGFQPDQLYVFKNYKTGVILRSEPRDRSLATGTLTWGREVVVLSYHRNWAEVQRIEADGTLGTLRGYMPERFLKRIGPYVGPGE